MASLRLPLLGRTIGDDLRAAAARCGDREALVVCSQNYRWQVKVVDVALGNDRRPRHRLILARNRETGERKYFVTNAPRRIGVRRVLAAGFVRWNVEHVFRVAKGEVGLTHFEGQSYVSLKRHLALCLVVLAFATLNTLQLRGEKCGGHSGTGLHDLGPGLPEIPEPAAGHV